MTRWTSDTLPGHRNPPKPPERSSPPHERPQAGISTPSAPPDATQGKKRGKPESILQAACVRWLGLQHPRLLPLLRAGAEGGSRNRIEAANLKRTGISPGWPDLHLADGRPGLWVELKAPGGTISKLQKQKHEALRAAGYPVAVCYTLEDFQTTINQYLSAQTLGIPKQQ